MTLLTHMEFGIAAAIFFEFSNKEIAEELHITPACVKLHIFRIHEKLKTKSRREISNWILTMR